MVVFKTAILVCLAASSNLHNPYASPLHTSSPSSTNIGASAALISNAPAAKDIQGVLLLLDNDVDSKTPKNPVILLSKPRSYKDSQALCSTLGESMFYPLLLLVRVIFNA
jgi:hypothetical protein